MIERHVLLVMAGLDPAIYTQAIGRHRVRSYDGPCVDGRVKPGHDA